MAASDLKDIAHKNILGHENTIIEKEQEMLSKMLQRKAMIKPVLLGYPSHAKIDLFIQRFQENNQPFLSLNPKQKNEIHQIWAITSVSDLAEIKEIFKVLVPKAYIADGHHRAKVTSELLEKSFLKDEDTTKHPALLRAFFPMHMLTIFEFNRVVTLPENMSLVQFIIHCSRLAEMKPLDGMSKPSSKYCLHLFIDHKWYVFKWREHILDKYLTQPIILDVDIFNMKSWKLSWESKMSKQLPISHIYPPKKMAMIGIEVSGSVVPTAANTLPTAPSEIFRRFPSHSMPFVKRWHPARVMTTEATNSPT